MMDLKGKCIGVLMGGWSPEREISLKSGRKVAESLRKQGFKVVEIDIGRKKGEPAGMSLQVINNLRKIDIAFIALHGVPGEDGTVQGMLEILGIPYTGSGVLASSICMDKIITKKVLMASGIRVPRYVEYQKLATEEVRKVLGEPPWVVKPVRCGSSVGIEIVKEEGKLESTFNKIKEEYGDAFIEEFIRGRDVTVGILGQEVLPVAELIPESEFFDYYAKYTPGVTQEIIPACLPEDVYKEVQTVALKAHRAVGCKCFSRIDMLLEAVGVAKPLPSRRELRSLKDNMVYVLEVNSIPGLTDISVLPAEASYIGISYDEVIYRILESAVRKY